MPYPRENLNQSEEIVLDTRPHWWYLVPQVVLLVVTIAAGVASLLLLPVPVQIASAVLILGALGWFLVKYIGWASTSFVITTDRLIDRSGVLNRSGIEIPLERVNTVHFHQTLFERMIGSGDLVIESAGEQGAQRVDDIPRPQKVQNEIYQQMEANENRKFDRVGRNLQSAAPSIPDQIEKLAELHRQGVLTDAEFQAKKKDLLDRL